MAQFQPWAVHRLARTVYSLHLNSISRRAELALPHTNTISIPPFVLKPPATLTRSTHPVVVHPHTQAHAGVALAAIVSRAACDVSVPDAMAHVGAYSLALDISTSDGNTTTKKEEVTALPFSYDTSTPLARPVPSAKVGDPHDVRLWARLNGTLVQDILLRNDLLLSVPEAVAALSKVVTLLPHDVILLGGPAGRFALEPGDVLLAGGMLPGAQAPLLQLQHKVALVSDL